MKFGFRHAFFLFQILTKEINKEIEKDVRARAGKFEAKSFHIVKDSAATSKKSSD